MRTFGRISFVMGLLCASPLFAELSITEICPRPEAPDPNGQEAGWIELTNMGQEAVNLKDYALIRWNRGKEDKKKNRKQLCDRELQPGERTVVYTSEAYPNYREKEQVAVYENDVMVFPFKVNPKKFPNIALYKWDAEKGEAKEKLQTFIVPVDLPDDKSFGPGALWQETEVAGADTPYTYAFADEASVYEGKGRLTVGTYALPSDLTGGLAEWTFAADAGVVSDVALEKTLDAAGVLQPGAYDFSAVTAQHIGVVATPSTRPAKAYTVSLWFRSAPSTTGRVEGSVGNGMPLFECRPSKTGNRTGVILFLNDANQLTVQPRSASDLITLDTDTEADYADEQWHHAVLVAGQSAGDALTLYVDGKAEIQAELPFDCVLQDEVPYHFGRAQDSTSWHLFNGQLADIRFYHYALSAEEVQQLAGENAAARTVTGQYGGFTAKASPATALTYDAQTQTYTFCGAADLAANLSYVENADQLTDTLCSGGETLDFWVKPSSLSATGKEAVVLMDARKGSDAGYLFLYGADEAFPELNGKFYIQRSVWPKTETVCFETEAGLDVGQWRHLTLTVDAATREMTLFIDGVKADSKTFTDYLPATTTRRFGGSHESYWRGFRGEMAEINLFSGALPAREVAKLHNASALATTKVTEAGTDSNADIYHSRTELCALSGEMTVALPPVDAGARLIFRAPETEGALTLSWNGEAVGTEQVIALAATSEASSGTLQWTLAPEGVESRRLSVAISAVLRSDVAGVTRAILPTLTPGAENDLEGARAYGPNIGPSNATTYEDFGYYLPEPTATPGEAFRVVLDVHPIAADAQNAIQSVELCYRAAFGEEKTVPMVFTEGAFLRVVEEEDDGGNEIEVEVPCDAYVGEIPAAAIPAPGQLIQFGARITDGAGRTWFSPSRNNPDDCPLWYGTIVTPEGLLSETLQTFHLFVEGDNLSLMDKDYDAVKGAHPLGARCGIYDSQTDTYYDNVRIDLRGNTSAGFAKKSHGLRFSKCQPLTCKNMLEGKKGTKLKEIRKTSFTSEFADPTFIRQSLSFHVWRNAGNKVPFHYPVRLNLNGAFYQLAFHSNRFTDELIEDYYGLDPMGYGYKNVGQISSTVGTTAGGVEKKTPDDGDETSSAAYAPLKAFAETFAHVENVSANDPGITGIVYDTFDLPAWINYLASARITQEADDVWANICLYWDKRGNDVWMPLAYDHNLSWGAWYFGDDSSQGRTGLKAADDNFKSHPFYGGRTINARRADGSLVKAGNYAVEALWQNADFRAMYLCRLRTLMDEHLKAPGTAKEDTPFWTDYVEKFKAAVAAEAVLDRAKWGNSYASTVIYVWDHILEWEEAYNDLWENYIVPRRVHLYETHSVTNESWEIGYAQDRNAGIPQAHPEVFAPILTARVEGGVRLTNPNTEAIDLSGWTVEGLIKHDEAFEDADNVVTLPPGTVLLGGKSLVLAYDRKAYIAANEPCFVIGLAAYGDDKVWIPGADGSAAAITLKKADGEIAMEDTLPAEVITWLTEAIAGGAVTAADLASVTAAADYRMAYLVNETPASDLAASTRLEIAAFAIDDTGTITLTVELHLGEEKVKTGTINGTIQLFASENLSGEAWEVSSDTGDARTFGASGMERKPVFSGAPRFFKARLVAP